MTDARTSDTERDDWQIGGVHVCATCDRVLREDRDEFLAVNDPDGGMRYYCDGHASKALDRLSRRDG
jgi:hypothetical protein